MGGAALQGPGALRLLGDVLLVAFSEMLLEVALLGEAAQAAGLVAAVGFLLGVLVAQVVLEVVAALERLLGPGTPLPAAMITAGLELPVGLLLFQHVGLEDVGPQQGQRLELLSAPFPSTCRKAIIRP